MVSFFYLCFGDYGFIELVAPIQPYTVLGDKEQEFRTYEQAKAACE